MTEPVVYRNISELRLWSRNYRQGDIGAIITSIRTFGFNGALRVWRDNVVIAGNHTLKALQEMQRSQEDAPHGVMVSAAGEWIVACVDVSHLSEHQAQAFAIADNRTAEIADNDDEQLAALLQEIALQDKALMAATGYDGDDLDAILTELNPHFEPMPLDEQPRLDKLDPQWVTCPKCSHRFDAREYRE